MTTEFRCTGWWEQTGCGRQPMKSLSLQILQTGILGSGQDMVGTFSLAGKLQPDGTVRILKQYHNRHHVLYVGMYDGEGTMSGLWEIGPDHGRWLIHFETMKGTTTSDIQEIIPA
ncbi:MAG: hypothetical protein KDA81_06880 [Planctomycetaceae bacterium]|nr:hypothetical protein [Planctomycetaceae bacterium]